MSVVESVEESQTHVSEYVAPVNRYDGTVHQTMIETFSTQLTRVLHTYICQKWMQDQNNQQLWASLRESPEEIVNPVFQTATESCLDTLFTIIVTLLRQKARKHLAEIVDSDLINELLDRLDIESVQHNTRRSTGIIPEQSMVTETAPQLSISRKHFMLFLGHVVRGICDKLLIVPAIVYGNGSVREQQFYMRSEVPNRVIKVVIQDCMNDIVTTDISATLLQAIHKTPKETDVMLRRPSSMIVNQSEMSPTSPMQAIKQEDTSEFEDLMKSLTAVPCSDKSETDKVRSQIVSGFFQDHLSEEQVERLESGKVGGEETGNYESFVDEATDKEEKKIELKTEESEDIDVDIMITPATPRHSEN